MSPLVRGLLIVLCACCWGPQALAHKPSDSYLHLTPTGEGAQGRWEVALRDLDLELALDADEDGVLRWGEVRPRWPAIQALVAQALAVTTSAGACAVATPQQPPELVTHGDGNYAVLPLNIRCPSGVRELKLAVALFAQTDPTHRVVLQWHAPPAQAQSGLPPTADAAFRPAVLAAGEAPRAFPHQPGASPRPLSVLLEFVAQGVEHIAAGTDHILFLLSLLLVSVVQRVPGAAGAASSGLSGWRAAPRWRTVLADVLRVVTAFTVGHSITLGLATYGVVSPASRWVESLIALSVLLSALNNLRPVVHHGRWALTLLFGLVHGFGFATVLQELGLDPHALLWPLLGFNVGVELGQLVIVAVVVPLAWTMRGTRFYQRWVLGGGSVLIALAACVWLLERVFDWRLMPGF